MEQQRFTFPSKQKPRSSCSTAQNLDVKPRRALSRDVNHTNEKLSGSRFGQEQVRRGGSRDRSWGGG